MIPHKALIKHDPASGKWGDCFRVSIACLLDIEDVASVPHFFDAGVCYEVGMSACKSWLNARKLSPITVALDGSLSLNEALEAAAECTDDPCILIGATVDGGHCVICKDGIVWHDVAWIKTPLLHGAGPGNEWLLIFIGAMVSRASLC